MDALRTARGLTAACHPEPACAVTLVSAGLAWSVGRGAAGTAAVAVAVLAGQLSIGWMNDYVDRDRDVRSGRADKPIARGGLPARTVQVAVAAAGIAVIPLSLLSGWFAGMLHLAAVGSAWAYNLRLKATALSVLPYAVSFGLLPAFVTAGLPGRPVIGWLVAAGALLGSGAHFANVLPDLADDLDTGIRGLPHRIGSRASRSAAGGSLLAASAVLAFGPRGGPGLIAVAGVLVAVVAAAAMLGGEGSGRGGGGSLDAFRAVLVVAAVDVLLLLSSGHTIR